MKIHEVKTLSEYFWPQVAGLKTFEVRYNDRDYEVGDILRQMEWDPRGHCYTGRTLDKEITYIMNNPKYCKYGLVILGLR